MGQFFCQCILDFFFLPSPRPSSRGMRRILLQVSARQCSQDPLALLPALLAAEFPLLPPRPLPASLLLLLFSSSSCSSSFSLTSCLFFYVCSPKEVFFFD